MKKLIFTKGTEFEQNDGDLAIIDTHFRAGKPIMLNSKDLDLAILNGQPEALDKIEVEDKRLQDKTIELEKNGAVELFPDEGYHGIGSVYIDAKVVEDLDDELSVIDEEIEAQTASVAEAFSLLQSRSALKQEAIPNINIYVQSEEPTFKEGIWLQTDEELVKDLDITNKTYKAVLNFDVWRQSNPDFNRVGCLNIEGTHCIYSVGGNQVYSSTKLTKYDFVTKTFETLPTMPFNMNWYAVGIEYENNLFMFGGDTDYNITNNSNKGLKYNIDTQEYTALTLMPFGCNPAKVLPLGNNLLILCGSIHKDSRNNKRSNKAFIYDIDNDIYTERTIPFYTYSNRRDAILIGDDLYLFGVYFSETDSITNKVFKWNITTDELTPLSDIPNSKSLSSANTCLMFGKIYISSGDIYDIASDTFETHPEFKATYSDFFMYIDETEEMVSGDRTVQYMKTKKVTAIPEYSNDRDCILLYQNKGLNKYHTSLIPYENASGRMLYGFDDLVYYSVEKGINATLPIYYGTGTKWIKIRG